MLFCFREKFYVQEEMLCVPKLYSPIPTCMLRVINNDTGQEVNKVFQKVAPYFYKKNKVGESRRRKTSEWVYDITIITI